MATVDEIEGVRPNVDGDTGSCSRQESRKYAFLLNIVQPGTCRKGRAATFSAHSFPSIVM